MTPSPVPSYEPATTPAGAPTLGLCLGAGGARGLAHIVLLEALDEMGLRPSLISGASMGAIIGAAYAAGLPGRDIRAHLLALTRDRSGSLARALASRADRATNGWLGAMGRPILVDGERFLGQFWPTAVPDAFEALKIPLIVTATDFFAAAPAVFETGPLAPAVAASMAMPGLVRAVHFNGRALVDGALVDPVPFEALVGRCGCVIASDVTGGPSDAGRSAPDRFEPLFYSAQILQAALLRERLRRIAPDILLRLPVDGFVGLDFFAASRILAAADAQRDAMKRDIEAGLSAAARKTP